MHALDEHGNTLLHVAASILLEPQCLTTTQILIEAGCDPFTPNIANKQPIHIAVSRGFNSVVKYLLSHVLDTGASLPPDLLFAAFNARAFLPVGLHPSIIQLLVDHGADVSHLAPNGDQLLHTILKSNMVNEDECLLTMTLLCEAGCNSFSPDFDGNTPLHLAITRGFTSVVAYLLSQDVPLPSDILFALYPPRRNLDKWISMISSLVHKGANVHAQDRNRNTPLHHVLSTGLLRDWYCLEVIKIFTEAGCSASIRNVGGKLPIQIAVARELPSVVEYLLSRNAPFPPDILLTVLRAQNVFPDGVLRMVSSFVERGADACVIAANGDTVLHVALAWQRNHLLDIVDVLVRAGCNPHARDAGGRTPLELAAANGHSGVAEYLQRILLDPVPATLTSSSPTE